jgi:hypothetical protein
VVWVFVAMENLLHDLWLVAAASASGGDSTGGVQSSTLQGENPRSGLKWLCLAMTLLKALFYEWGVSRGWKPKLYDRATAALVHRFLLGGVAFGEVGFLVLFWWCSYCYKKLITVAGLFFFVFLLLLLVVCIRIAARTLRCCRGYVYLVSSWY